jgi:hypothetical protein
MKYLFFLSMIAFSCYTPSKLAQKCAEQFPCLSDTITVDSIVIKAVPIVFPGKIIRIKDTVFCDSIPKIVIHELAVQCPDDTINHDTIYITRTFKTRDSAVIYLLKYQIDSLKKEGLNKDVRLESYKKKIKTRNWALVILVLVALISMSFKRIGCVISFVPQLLSMFNTLFNPKK